jgi:hypothetical protein
VILHVGDLKSGLEKRVELTNLRFIHERVPVLCEQAVLLLLLRERHAGVDLRASDGNRGAFKPAKHHQHLAYFRRESACLRCFDVGITPKDASLGRSTVVSAR